MAKRAYTPKSSDNIAAGVISAILLIAFGIVLILSGVNAINVDASKIWLPAMLTMMGLSGVVTGIFRRESGTAWFGVVALTCAVCVFLGNFGVQTYRYLYPMFIAAPGVASLALLPFVKDKKNNLVSVIFFGGMSIIFVLKAFDLIKTWIFVVGIVVVMIGLISFVTVVTSKKGRWDDGDTVPKPRGRKWDDGDELPPKTDEQDGQ